MHTTTQAKKELLHKTQWKSPAFSRQPQLCISPIPPPPPLPLVKECGLLYWKHILSSLPFPLHCGIAILRDGTKRDREGKVHMPPCAPRHFGHRQPSVGRRMSRVWVFSWRFGESESILLVFLSVFTLKMPLKFNWLAKPPGSDSTLRISKGRRGDGTTHKIKR